MSPTTKVLRTDPGRIGVMVRTSTEIVVYWELANEPAVTVRILDKTGRPAVQSLDGTGIREVAAPAGARVAYLSGLEPGRLYMVEVGVGQGDSYSRLLSAGPVQTPRAPGAEPDGAKFPPPYHRS